jgi:hypothetical protein
LHIWYFLQADKQYQASPAINLQYMNLNNHLSSVSLHLSPANYQYFINKNNGIKQQGKYLLPTTYIQYAQENSINDNEVFITKDSCSNKLNYTTATHTYTFFCASSKNNFTCPPKIQRRYINPLLTLIFILNKYVFYQ